MITALSFLDIFEDYQSFKDFTDTIGLYDDQQDTVSETFNQSIYWNIVNRYGNTDVNYYEEDPFKAEFTIAYEQYFKQFLSKKKIVDATNGISLDDYQIISESLSNFANNPNTLTTDPWELLTYTAQQQRGRAKAGKLTAYINALRQLPDAQIDAFLDKIDYMWSNLLSDSHACCGEDIDGTVVYVNGQYQRKWSPDTIIENIELMNEELEGKQDALTPAQQNAVDSGIDSTKVAQIQTNADNIVILQAIKYGASIQATIDTSTYVMTIQLKDQDDNNLGTAQTIDLPLESVVVSGSYDSVNKALVLTLQNGNTISIPVGDLISGLQTEITSSNKLSADLVDDTNTTNKFVTTSEKSTWNAKQNAGEAVLFSEAQTLTEAQKLQARQNIGAGSSGFSGDYDDLSNRPTLDTTPTTAQTTNASETITGNIKLHKISKTGTLADAIEDSTHRTVTDTEKSTWSGKQDALGYTPYNSTNPNGYLNSAGVVDLIYPVGSIYMSVNSTSPSSLFGGTWVQLKDRFLLGAGDTYTNGDTGGEATHTLTIDEMPSHTHGNYLKFNTGGNSGESNYSVAGSNNWWIDDYNRVVIQNTGGSQAHNNMPPYLVVYMWKRTA